MVKSVANLKRVDRATELFRWWLEVNEIRADAAQLLQHPSQDGRYLQDLLTILRRCEEVDAKFQQYMKSENDRCAVSPSVPTSRQSGLSPDNDVLGRRNPYIEHQLPGVRILLHETVLECTYMYQRLNILSGEMDGLQTYRRYTNSLALIDTTASQILYSIQSLLGWPIPGAELYCGSPHEFQGSGEAAIALGSLWPLGVISRCPVTGAQQVETASKLADYIAHTFGIRRVLTLKGIWGGVRAAAQNQSHWSQQVLGNVYAFSLLEDDAFVGLL